MDKAYLGMTWENRPSTVSPIDEINLNAISSALSIIDDRVIANYNTLQDSVSSITIDEDTGEIVVYEHDGDRYSFNFATNIYQTISANQQAANQQFSQIRTNLGDVHDALDAMDLKIDITAEGANAGITQLRTEIIQNDGYYRQTMTGLSTSIENVAQSADASVNDVRDYVTTVQSSLTQTTQAIQLSVQSVTQSVDDLSGSLDNNVAILQSQINVTAGDISLKVSKLEVIDDLQHEFGSGIEITPDRITFASTGAMVVNTQNFKLDAEGNAEFAGHVDMASGSVAGKPLLTSSGDSSELSIDHVNNAWKLRSARVDDYGTRYYTYLTKNKLFIVSTDHEQGHNNENDVTDRCSIGSKSYPWHKGYYKALRIQEEISGSKITHDVLPEGLDITIPTGWTQDGDIYTKTITVNGVKKDRSYLYLATSTLANLKLVYKHRIEVDTFANNTVTFIAETEPSESISVTLLVEDYVSPSMQGAELTATFDESTQQLSANWASPDDISKFITWQSDALVIQKWNESTSQWEDAYIAPESGEPAFTENQFETDPLVIGGS